MDNIEFVNINGGQIPVKEALISFRNRAQLYGDGVFETIKVNEGKICFLDMHLNRLFSSLQFLKMKTPENWSVEFFENKIKDLLKANNTETAARIRITVFRESNGFYTPDNNECSYIIDCHKSSESSYLLNAKGITIDIFSEIKKPFNKLSNIKSLNALPYILAGINKLEKKLDDCILLNDASSVAEAISSNVFIVVNGVIYTPSISEACIDGVMRKVIMQIAAKNGIKIYETSLKPNDLIRADEVFLTNAVKGITWVGAYRSKRYFNNTSRKLTDLLNQSISELN